MENRKTSQFHRDEVQEWIEGNEECLGKKCYICGDRLSIYNKKKTCNKHVEDEKIRIWH